MDFDSSDDGSLYGDIPTRPMRVKVLYSFDSDSKVNCLARFPNTLQIPAIAIDESSQVGVIELKQCIQAVVAASPELLARLTDGDFAVYNFDYSEEDNPLVGQGMLSAVLASASPVTGTEKTMITGRVCKNMPALFSNGVKETLEVKLRLVPVPKAAPPAAPRMETPRGVSSAMSGGFDPNAFSACMNQQRPHSGSNDFFRLDATGSTGDALVDEIFGLASGVSETQAAASVGTAQTPTDSQFTFNPAFAPNSHSAPGSRSGSPMILHESGSHNEHLRHQSFSGQPQNFLEQSRPESRASMHSEGLAYDAHDTSTASTQPQSQFSNEYFFNEDGQQRKRAKVTQTDWRGKSSFGSKSSDLRVTAATAASMHMHRPIARQPSAHGRDLEPPPRMPTPVPQRTILLPHQRGPQGSAMRSMLRQASTVDSDIMSDLDQFSDAIASSPEDGSPSNDATPADLPSSPPVFPGVSQTQPSSPGLPALPSSYRADSGYMSERTFPSSNIVESMETDAHRSRRRQGLAQNSMKTERQSLERSLSSIDAAGGGIEVRLETPGDMNQLPQRILLDIPPSRQRQMSRAPRQRALSMRSDAGPAQDQVMMSEGAQSPAPEGSLSRRGSLALPPNLPSTLASESEGGESQPFRKLASKGQSLRRSQTYVESETGSPAPSDNEGGRPRGPKRSGSGAPRRVVIKERLENALKRGDMPQYCHHCGSIETPTWRKLYVKTCEGKPSPLDYVEGEGETIGIEDLDKDAAGEVTRFIIRKTMKRTKETQPGAGFEDISVCNPCGLWFNKFRSMRPADKWHKKSSTRRGKKKLGADGAEFATDSINPQSDAFFTDTVGPEDLAEDQIDGRIADGADEHRPQNRRTRASSMQPTSVRRNSDGLNASQLSRALTRQVQSSPGSFGSQHSPIEIEDLTPRPTRRLLFPSPRKDGEVKALDDNGQASLNATSAPHKPKSSKFTSNFKGDVVPGNTNVNVFDVFTHEKENLVPSLMDQADVDPFDGLFDGSPTSFFKTPGKTPSKETTTPPRSQRHINHLLKTPTPASRKRKVPTPNENPANEQSTLPSASANDFMTSPTSARYFLRSTPSRLNRTPGRLSAGTRSDEPSPFSRHLAQMLSDGIDTGLPTTSPSRGFDFSDLPTFTTPGRNMDWAGIDDMLSSDFAAFDNSDSVLPHGANGGP